MDFNYGDKVIIKTVKEEIEGIILESGEIGIYLLKLKSGYNIGVQKEDIVSIKVLEARRLDKKIKTEKIKENDKLPKIDMIITGGTISSRLDYETGAVKSLTTPEQLIEVYPELKEIVNIRKIKVPFTKFSESMDSLDWKEIAEEVEKSLNDKEIEGVIISHGTDTLHYTSSALSFFLKDLNKPVVLTYSQRSSDRASSDARLNLKCAAYASISDIAEVMIVGHGSMNDDFCYALKGSKVRKMHASRRDAFKSINEKPIAKIYGDGKIEKIGNYKLRDNNKKVKLDTSYNDKIALIKFYPGMPPDVFDALSLKYQGIVLEVVGLGQVAGEEARKNLIPSIKKATDNGLIVCAVAQTIYGGLNENVYSTGRLLKKAGVIFLGDMLSETAFVKLGFVLGHKDWRSKIKEKMLENINGEINKRLEI